MNNDLEVRAREFLALQLPKDDRFQLDLIAGDYSDLDAVNVYIAIAAIAAALSQQPSGEHPDDAAVDTFAAAMKAKLAEARSKGRGGWDDKDDCTQQRLSDMLRNHVVKGDPRDVANFAMFLHQRGESIAPSQQASAEGRYEIAAKTFLEKTDWVQRTTTTKELGKHRADILRERIEDLTKQVSQQASAKGVAEALTNIIAGTPMDDKLFHAAAEALSQQASAEGFSAIDMMEARRQERERLQAAGVPDAGDALEKAQATIAALSQQPSAVAEPVAWLCKASDGSLEGIDATSSNDARDLYARMGREIIPLYAAPKQAAVVTRDEAGNIVAVTRQDDEHRILSIIAEAPQQPDWLCDTCKKTTPTTSEGECVVCAQQVAGVPEGVDWGRFASWLLDECEGMIVSEEMLHREVCEMIAAAPKPAGEHHD